MIENLGAVSGAAWPAGPTGYSPRRDSLLNGESVDSATFWRMMTSSTYFLSASLRRRMGTVVVLPVLFSTRTWPSRIAIKRPSMR